MERRCAPMCWICRHYDDSAGVMACAAFPEGIPQPIIDFEFDHREPHPDDNGVQFEPLPDCTSARLAAILRPFELMKS